MIKLDAKITIASQEDAKLESAKNMEIGGSTEEELYGDLESVLGETNATTPYVGTQTCDENGVFARENVITISGKNLMLVNVAFDTINNQYPKKIYSSNFTKRETLSFANVAGAVSGTYRIIVIEEEIDEPLISASIVSRTPHQNTGSTLTPTMIRSSIGIIEGNKVRVEEFWQSGNTASVDYVIEIETLSKESAKEIVLSSPIVDVGLGKPDDKIMFLVSDWNTPNSKMVIRGIYLPEGVTYQVDSGSLMSFSAQKTDREDVEFPSYGVVANSGNIKFIDKNGMIYKYMEAGTFTKDAKISAFMENTLTGLRTKVCDMFAESWSYGVDNNVVSVSLNDGLERLQNIDFEGYPFSTQKSLLELYQYLQKLVPETFEFEDLDDDTRTFMSKISIGRPYLESGSLWSAFDKIAKVGALHIYKENDKIVTKHLF